MKISQTNKINRIIDANLNRAKEGLRVCEEVTRFILDSHSLTEGFKKIRHQIDGLLKKIPPKIKLLSERKSLKDVGLNIYLKSEFKRQDFRDVFFANIQRVKESIRVLEEFFKLKNIRLAARFKEIRYDLYEIEKKVAKKFSTLRHH